MYQKINLLATQVGHKALTLSQFMKWKQAARGWRSASSPEFARSPAGDKQPINRRCNLARKEWRHSISNLDKLLRPIALKEIVVRKRLETSSLSNCQAPALR